MVECRRDVCQRISQPKQMTLNSATARHDMHCNLCLQCSAYRVEGLSKAVWKAADLCGRDEGEYS